MSRFVKAFKEKNNNLMSLHINICTNIEDLKNIELNALPVRSNRYIKNKIGTYDN